MRKLNFDEIVKLFKYFSLSPFTSNHISFQGIGHVCHYCSIRCCARCGGKVTLRSNKVNFNFLHFLLITIPSGVIDFNDSMRERSSLNPPTQPTNQPTLTIRDFSFMEIFVIGKKTIIEWKWLWKSHRWLVTNEWLMTSLQRERDGTKGVREKIKLDVSLV